MTEPLLVVNFGAMTHPGLVRAANEDSYLTVPPVFLVADGMGGHARGEVASRTVVDTFAELSSHQWLTSDDLVTTVDRAAQRVVALGGEGRAPGSTVSGVGMSEQGGMPCWLVFNVGDSRTHLLREGELTQISEDHSAVARGDLTKPKNVITRALGAGLSRPVADQWLIPAAAGDRILICSDGLSNEVTAELLVATLQAHSNPQVAATALVEAAVNAGGRDNVTAVVVDCVEVVSSASHSVSIDDSTASADDEDTVPIDEGEQS